MEVGRKNQMCKEGMPDESTFLGSSSLPRSSNEYKNGRDPAGSGVLDGTEIFQENP